MEKLRLNVDGTDIFFEGETQEERLGKMSAYLHEIQKPFREKHANDEEVSAENANGFFLYSPVTKGLFFRMYNYDPINKTAFTDYKICCEEIEVQIQGNDLAFYHNDQGEHRLDWSSRILGRKPKSQKPDLSLETHLL